MKALLSRPGEKLSDHIWRAYKVFEETFGERLTEGLRRYMIAMIVLHDIAKADSKFQECLNSMEEKRASVPHSPLSAFIAYAVTKNAYVTYAIYYHHQDMKNVFSFSHPGTSFVDIVESSYIKLSSKLESLKDQSYRVLHELRTHGSDILECIDCIYGSLSGGGLKDDILKVLQEFSSSRSEIKNCLEELCQDLWKILKETDDSDALFEVYYAFRLYYSVLKYCDTVSVFMGDKLGGFSQNKASGI